MAATAERISPREARALLDSDSALLVCAYDDEEKCRTNHLEGSISLKEFESRLPSISDDQQIIFYCA